MKTQRRRSAFLRNLGGIAFLVMAAVNEFVVEAPSTANTLGFATLGVALIAIGRGRIYRPGIARLPDRITCRFIPWSEGDPYWALIIVPLMGVWMIASASEFASTATLVRVVGVFILAVTPVSLFVFAREWRRCFLCITPSALIVSLPTERYALKEIRREDIQSVDPAIGNRMNHVRTAMTRITFHAEDSSPSSPASVLIGPSNSKNAVWLSVEPANLLAALQVWKDADTDNTGLLDHIEPMLRGRDDRSQP